MPYLSVTAAADVVQVQVSSTLRLDVYRYRTGTSDWIEFMVSGTERAKCRQSIGSYALHSNSSATLTVLENSPTRVQLLHVSDYAAAFFTETRSLLTIYEDRIFLDFSFDLSTAYTITPQTYEGILTFHHNSAITAAVYNNTLVSTNEATLSTGTYNIATYLGLETTYLDGVLVLLNDSDGIINQYYHSSWGVSQRLISIEIAAGTYSVQGMLRFDESLTALDTALERTAVAAQYKDLIIS